MSLFLKRQLYCCVTRSRCQKVFQRLEKNLRKPAQRLHSLAEPEPLVSPTNAVATCVVNFALPACAVCSHPPLPSHRPVRSRESLPSSGEFPLWQQTARPPEGESPARCAGKHLTAQGVRHRQAQAMRSAAGMLRG